MNFDTLLNLDDKIKGGFTIIIGEIVFNQISERDCRYSEGRKALDKCWKWFENGNIIGADLYEIIDNAECKGIMEYAQKEENENISLLWFLLVDIVAYISWIQFNKENVNYLPQALEEIENDSLIVLIESAIETTFITEEEIISIQVRLLDNFDSDDSMCVNKEDFICKVLEKSKND